MQFVFRVVVLEKAFNKKTNEHLVVRSTRWIKPTVAFLFFNSFIFKIKCHFVICNFILFYVIEFYAVEVLHIFFFDDVNRLFIIMAKTLFIQIRYFLLFHLYSLRTLWLEARLEGGCPDFKRINFFMQWGWRIGKNPNSNFREWGE